MFVNETLALAHFAAESTGGRIASICEAQNSTCRLHALPDCTLKQCDPSLVALIFPFTAVAIGCLIKPIGKGKFIRLIPYTLLQLLLGLALGVIGCSRDLGLLTVSIQQWVHLSPPDLFFYIFLAPLIFEAAFNTEWHIFRRLLFPIFIAAFPIVLAQAALIAVFTRFITSGWSWWLALMFGAMLSATDPISVTATIKELGASEYLGTLIEGESLVNDGSAFVFWEVLFHNSVSEGEDMFTVGQMVSKILQSTFGGILIGVAFSLAALIIIAVLYDEFEVETSLTVTVAFLGFWTAQSPAHLSGVIANVAAGLMLSALGKPLVSPSVRHPLSEFWELLGWIANTIVFFHGGVLTVAFIWPCNSHPSEASNYLLIFAIYGFLQVIRIGLFGLAYPLLSWRNRWFSLKKSFIVGFSGLRGSVSLILALNVAGASAIDSYIRYKVQIWTTGVVFLSLVVNGLLIPVLLSCLGENEPNNTRKKFIRQARALMVQETLTTLDKLCVDIGYRAARWSFVLEHVLPNEWLKEANIDKLYKHAVVEMKQRHVNIGQTDRRMSLEDDLLKSSKSDEQENVPPRSASFAGRAFSFWNIRNLHSSLDLLNPRKSRESSTQDEVVDSSDYCVTISLDPSDKNADVDTEVRRRVLISILSYVRAISSSTLTEFAALQSLEEDIQSALDANEEGEDYLLFEKLDNRNLYTRIMLSISKRTNYYRFNEENIIIGSVLYFALTQALKMKLLEESKVVKFEVLQMYHAIAFRLNERERESPEVFEWVHTLFAIHRTMGRQDKFLHEIETQGVIDDFEAKLLHKKLVEVRQKESLMMLWRGQAWKKTFGKKTLSKERIMKRILNYPIFEGLEEDLELQDVRFIHEVPAGDTISCAETPFVLVVQGAIKRTDMSTVIVNIRNRGGDARDTKLGVKCRPYWRKNEKRPSDEESGPSTGRASSDSSSHHWAFAKPSIICSMKLICQLNNTGESFVCAVGNSSTEGKELKASNSADSTWVYRLGEKAVINLAKKSAAFIDELTRSLAHKLLLSNLSEEATHDLRQLNEALEDQLDENSAPGLAFKMLERLPYMTVIPITGKATFRGPGMLVNGKVKISLTDTIGLSGNDYVPYTVLEGPCILPSEEFNFENADDRVDQLFEADKAYGHVLIERGHESAEMIARARIKRWNQKSSHRIDANGRFRIFRHITHTG